MSYLREEIDLAKANGETLFYNSSGSKQAYQLGVKHLYSAEFLGFADSLPNGNLRIKKEFLLVDFENKNIIKISKNMILTPIALQSL